MSGVSEWKPTCVLEALDELGAHLLDAVCHHASLLKPVARKRKGEHKQKQSMLLAFSLGDEEKKHAQTRSCMHRHKHRSLSLCLSVCLSLCLSVCLSVCLSLSLCLLRLSVNAQE